MNDWNILKFIKTGFWLGVGFIVPSLIVFGIGSYIMIGVATKIFEENFAQNDENSDTTQTMSTLRSKFDKTSQVEILEHYELLNGEELLILGKIINTAASDVDSIGLEAELFDSEGRFIYECRNFLSKRLRGGEVENFQIRCGDREQAAPAFASINVQIVSSSAN